MTDEEPGHLIIKQLMTQAKIELGIGQADEPRFMAYLVKAFVSGMEHAEKIMEQTLGTGREPPK